MQNVLILGGGSDLGIALARKYASQQFSISVSGRNLPEMEKIAADLEIRFNVQAKGYEFDVCDFKSHTEFYKKLEIKPSITICVVGFMGNTIIDLENLPDILQVINTNYAGPVSICNVIANQYSLSGSGLIIGISSVAGDRGRATNFIYGSAKAGFTAYLSGLRNRLYNEKLHVLTVKPGFMYTRMTQNLQLPTLLTATVDQVATSIYAAGLAKKNIIYVKWFWRYLMVIITTIPEFIFKKLHI